MARTTFKNEHSLGNIGIRTRRAENSRHSRLMDWVFLGMYTDKRKDEAQRIRDKYPDRIPVIVEKAERSDIPEIDKKK